MIDQNEIYDGDWIMARPLGLDEPFSRSNGTVIARLYERLTKASRRRVEKREQEHFFPLDAAKQEDAYRRGVYDAFKALQEELSE